MLGGPGFPPNIVAEGKRKIAKHEYDIGRSSCMLHAIVESNMIMPHSSPTPHVVLVPGNKSCACPVSGALSC